MRWYSFQAVMLCASTCMVQGAWAATAERDASYPSRSLRFIVPFAAGGANDIVGRILAQRLTEALGQQVVVDNRGGSGGVIGSDIVAKAAPDGYTLLLANPGPNAINPHMHPKLPYRPLEDFAPVSFVGSVPMILVVGAQLPARSAKELVALAKARPGQLSFASSGQGSSVHLAFESLKQLAGIDMVHIPYKGTAPALTDIFGGQVAGMFTTTIVAQPLIAAGRLRALAVASRERIAAAPEIPTLHESGFAGFEASIWYGVLAPARTSQPVIDRLNREIVRILATQDLRERFAALGAEPQSSTPAGFGRLLAEELVRWGQVVKTSGARTE